MINIEIFLSGLDIENLTKFQGEWPVVSHVMAQSKALSNKEKNAFFLRGREYWQHLHQGRHTQAHILFR